MSSLFTAFSFSASTAGARPWPVRATKSRSARTLESFEGQAPGLEQFVESRVARRRAKTRLSSLRIERRHRVKEGDEFAAAQDELIESHTAPRRRFPLDE